MNVFSRGDHLKLQQDLVREYFGDDVFIYVFCNSNRDFRHKEDLYLQTAVNSGHHNGVRDSYNATAELLDGFDLVVSTHADCIFTDYSVVKTILEEMEYTDLGYQYQFASLAKRKGINPHRQGLGHLPRAHVDFFVCRPWLFKSIFPTSYDMDEWEGIECFMGREVEKNLLRPEQWWTIQADEHFDNQEERPGIYVQRPYRFDGIDYGAVSLLRDNEFTPTRENYEAFKETLKSRQDMVSSQNE